MANDDLPPALWQGDESTGAQIAHWERRRWAQFHAAIVSATSSSDAGVLGNFPQEAQQELKEQELKQKVELFWPVLFGLILIVTLLTFS